MSGPKSARYSITDALSNLQSATQELAAAAERRRQHEEEQRRLAQERAQREAEARARAEEALKRERARLARLGSVRATRRRLALVQDRLAGMIAALPPAEGNPTLPVLPEIEDESFEGLDSTQRALEGVSRRLDEIRARVDTANALADLDLTGLGEAASLQEMLEQFAHCVDTAGARLPGQASEVVAATERGEQIRRIVGRLLEVSVDDLPAALEVLAQKAIVADSSTRFEMLCTELRLQVQSHNARVTSRRRASELADGWLAKLTPLDVEARWADLRLALQQVQQGFRPWDSDLQTLCDNALAKLEAAAQVRRDAHAAEILEDTLRDLGYEVEGIAQTLFAEGGTVFFQGKGWNEYYMRLRVSPERGSLHFNMVRAADTVAPAQRDPEMEQQWCAGYPELMRTLAARGIAATPLRALAAGALAVEQVQRNALPKPQSRTERQAAPPARRRSEQ
jgi:hypothetical protein